MTKIDLENSGFTLCVKTPRQEPYKDEGGIWKPGEGTRQHLGFESIKKLYAPEGTQVETSEIPFVEMRK